MLLGTVKPRGRGDWEEKAMLLYQNVEKTPRDRAEDLLSRMTLREKVGQINQKLYGFSAYERTKDGIRLSPKFRAEVEKWGGLGVLYGLYRADPWSQRDFRSGLAGADMKRAYNAAQRYVVEHSRFGVPMLMSSECPHGHQALDGYLLPVNLAVGAAWNPGLAQRAFGVCGEQLRELGVDFALVSMLDVLRDPRWGRSEECYSEDPLLAAVLAKSVVLGCQGAGVAVVAKHFCAQGETTGGVNASAAGIGPRELREIHLPPMKACCEAGVQGVMAAYNEIDGVFCHANRKLLRQVLREELGFDGIVMADGVAIDRLDSLTGDSAASGALALEAGVDVGLWDQAFSCLEQAVQQGLVSEKEVDRAALRVLELKFRKGLFEHPYLEEGEPRKFSYEKFPESLELSRQSPVLLKNDGILPLKKKAGLRVAVIGPNADDLYNQLGDYTPPQRGNVGVTLLQGLREQLGQESVFFSPGCTVCGGEREGIPAAVELAENSDVVILALGGSSSRFAGARFDTNGAAVARGPKQMDCGEGVDSPTLALPGAQAALAEAVFQTGKPVAAVFIAGRPYAVGEIARRANAVLYAFYPGPMGGKALAELLTGAFSPSGRLPASLPVGPGSLPCYYNAKLPCLPAEERADYPFGYGLSYTRFRFSRVRFPGGMTRAQLEAGNRAEVRFTIENAGDMDAYAVPQLFLRDCQASTARRIKELKAFDKVFLKAGEKRTCSLSLGREELSLWNGEMEFVLEPGEFLLFLEEGGCRQAQGVFSVAP